MGELRHNEKCTEFDQCGECLAQWLENQYRRYKEDEDRQAAALLRALIPELTIFREQKQMEEQTAQATGAGTPTRL